MSTEINPFDILSGKTVIGEDGVYYFNDVGNNTDEYRSPIYENLRMVKWNTGATQYFKNGLAHREDGPAYIGAGGRMMWMLKSICYYTEEEFKIALNKYRAQNGPV